MAKNTKQPTAEEIMSEAQLSQEVDYWPDQNDGAGVLDSGADSEFYFQPSPGRSVWGKLLGVESLNMPSLNHLGEREDRPFLLMELTRPAYAARAREKTPSLVGTGTRIRIGIRAKLAPLVRLCYMPFPFLVGIRCLHEVPLSSGRRMWKFQFSAQPLDEPARVSASIFGGVTADPERIEEILGQETPETWKEGMRRMTFQDFMDFVQGRSSLASLAAGEKAAPLALPATAGETDESGQTSEQG